MAFLLYFFVLILSQNRLITCAQRDHLRKSNIISKYHLQNASAGSDAVKEAVDFFKSQNTPSKVYSSSPNQLSQDSYAKYVKTQHSTLPLCSVSIENIQSHGMFLYHDTAPPYIDCYARRSRYHVAPRCEEQEMAAGIVPIYKWHWTLKQAYLGHCRMPSTNIFDAAASYVHRHKSNAKNVTILMLGLSFMAQPYLSLICLNQHHVDAARSYVSMYNERYVLKDIIADGGQCTGTTISEIPQYYSPTIHGRNFTLPKQHHNVCSLHHSIMHFTPPSSSKAPEIRVCYVYSFNLQKNLKAHSPLPCNLTWSEIDVIFGLHGKEEMLRYYIPRTDTSPQALSHVTYIQVNKIYQATLVAQLRAAYTAYKFREIDVSNIQAKPMSCERADIHYRLPGITDYAINIWLQLMGYGLPEKKDTGITFLE